MSFKPSTNFNGLFFHISRRDWKLLEHRLQEEDAREEAGGLLEENGRLPLHYALASDCTSVSAVRQLLELSPPSNSTAWWLGFPTKLWDPKTRHTTLEIALESKCSDEVIMALLDELPELARIGRGRENGVTPFHTAVQRPKVFLRLLDIHPNGCRDLDDNGMLPLHKLCEQLDLDASILKQLYRAHPSAFTERTKRGMLAFEIMLETQHYKMSDAVTEFLQLCPECAAMTTSAGESMLHRAACQLHVQASDVNDGKIFRALLRANPMAAAMRDGGLLPLHQACLAPSTALDVINVLLEHFPDGARARSNSGFLPLHFLCMLSREPARGVLKRVLAAHPDAIHERDSSGRLPIHLALNHRQSDLPNSTFRGLRDRWPESILIPLEGSKHKFRTCFDIARDVHGWTIEKLMTETFGNLGEPCNRNGDLPIHVACRNAMPADVLAELIRLYPNGLQTPDGRGRLPLHVLCQDSRGPDNLTNDRLKVLLSAYYPALCSAENGLGSPQHPACFVAAAFSDGHPDVLFTLLREDPLAIQHTIEVGTTNDPPLS